MKTKLLSFALLCSSAIGLTQNCINSTNQIDNPNFSWGGFNQGFSSDLPKSATCLEASYLVSTSLTAKCTDWGWANFQDHTTGTGNFLIIDGHGTTATQVWRASGGTVSPNITYNFSFWARSIYTEAFQLEFMVDGVVVGTSTNITAGAWNKYAITWNSGATSGSVILSIRQKTGGAYRDFGLDDISFGPCSDIITGCGAAYTTNIVQNANFSSGDTGFYSELEENYPYCNDSTYFVTTLPSLKCLYWLPVDFTDHTTGTGNMMLADGDEHSARALWMQDVTVSPYRTYTFSFWARSIHTEGFKIEFIVGPTTIGLSNNITFGSWGKYSATWYSGVTSGPIRIRLKFQTEGEKRDFGLDDIFFGYCSEGFANANDPIQQEAASEISLFPNPSNGAFTLVANTEYEKNIFVYDVMGKVVFEKLKATQKSINIDISNLAKGIYIVKVLNGNNCQVKKMIVE